MYAKVSVEQGASAHYVTLPASAITYNPYGSTVFLVDEKGKNEKGEPMLTVHQTFVTTGQARGDQITILNGVKDGDRVVIAGQVKLRNGVPVIINNRVVPTSNANPNTPDN